MQFNMAYSQNKIMPENMRSKESVNSDSSKNMLLESDSLKTNHEALYLRKMIPSDSEDINQDKSGDQNKSSEDQTKFQRKMQVQKKMKMKKDHRHKKKAK